ncbi:cap-specific mRNA (nucleoside-2'-O-)-methyltransferase 2-like [Saccoglossus kowalevskii]
MGRKRKRSRNFRSQMGKSKRSDTYDPGIVNEASAMFNKRFTFDSPEEQRWSLPGVEKIYSDEDEIYDVLQQLKCELNLTKSELSDKDIEKWHSHTMFTNKAGRVVPQIRSEFNLELCTQAWCKFHEILATFDIIRDNKLNTVHLCEAPGAFVTSLNHYIKTNNPDTEWNWLATTLNPYYEDHSLSNMIPDDRFIYQTINNWYFGEDNTGDIMDVRLMKGLAAKITEKLGTVHLITADGSIDCQCDPAEQEMLVYQLHYCEIITSLYCLSDGGTLVIKMFTLYEHSSVAMMYLLNCVFDKVHVFKPATSKSGNSEVYVVCLNYNGKLSLQKYFPVFLNKFGSTRQNEAMFSKCDIPESFTSQLIECAKLFKDFQTDTIKNNIRLYQNMSDEEKSHIEQVRNCCLGMYVERFGIKPISVEDRICPDLYKEEYNMRYFVMTSMKTHYTGSYNDRRDTENWWRSMDHQVNQWILQENQVFHFKHETSPDNNMLSKLEILKGKPIQEIHSSRFCHPKLLENLNKVQDTAQIFKPENKGAMVELLSSCDEKKEGNIFQIVQFEVENVMHKFQESTIECIALCSKQLLDWLLSEDCTKNQLTVINPFEKDQEVGESDVKVNPFSLLRFCSNCDGPCVQLVIICYNSNEKGHSCMELETKNNLLIYILTALKTLNGGGTLIIKTSTFLTRFSTGLLYILLASFQKVKVHVLSSYPAECIVVCDNYNPNDEFTQDLLTHSEDIIKQKANNEENYVLEILPMKCLYEYSFYKTVVKINDHLLKIQTSNTVYMERTFQGKNE